MIALARYGRHSEAIEIAERLLKDRVITFKKKKRTLTPSSTTLVEVAACYGICSEATKNKEDADKWRELGLKHLERAVVEKKFSDATRVKYDPDLQGLRNDRRFVKLQQAVEAAQTRRTSRPDESL